MSAVVGCDLSSFAVDLVKLDESSNRAEWVRCELSGKDAWERTLDIRRACYQEQVSAEWYDDVYLVAIEAPYGYGSDLLNRVVGAVAASLPAALRAPERCWIVRPDEWKKGLGLKGKPTVADVERLLPDCELEGMRSTLWTAGMQDTWDALCIALFARDTNARAVATNLGKDAA